VIRERSNTVLLVSPNNRILGEYMIDRFTIQTDHYQFFLEDSLAAVETPDLWDADALRAMVGVADGLIAVGTVRYGGETHVVVEVRTDSPPLDRDVWDQIVQCSIGVTSGTLLLSSVEGIPRSGPRIQVLPGDYQVLVLFGNLSSVTDDNARSGEDIYHLILWPGLLQDVVILKSMQT